MNGSLRYSLFDILQFSEVFAIGANIEIPQTPLLRPLNTRPPRLSPPQADDGGQVEQQNKKPQNHQGFTSIFDIPCWTFCGSQKFLPLVPTGKISSRQGRG